MEAVLSVIQNIMDMGASVMLPVVIFILSCVFSMKIGKALKTGLLVGIGFQGLGLVVGLLGTSLQPAIDYYQEMGSGYTTMDVGWAAVGAASWSVPFAAIAILMIVGLNVLFILLKWTTVMNVDIWNYIHFLIPGALAYALFDSFWLGLTVTVGLSIVTLFVAQWFAPRWEAYYGLEGTTCTTFSFITFAYPFGLLVNKLIDLIPGLNKIDISLEKVESKIGFFGDPAVIGLLVGTFLGVLTRQEFTVAISMGGGVSAVLVLIPKMVSVMMEGLTAIGEAAKEFMKKHIGEGKKLYIGMDIALGLGDPTAITTTVILIPIAIFLAFIIPGMHYFPVGVLTVIVYMIPLLALASNGNLFRTLVTAFFFLVIVLIGTNTFAPEATEMMNATGVPVEGVVTDSFWGYNLANIIISLFHRIVG